MGTGSPVNLTMRVIAADGAYGEGGGLSGVDAGGGVGVTGAGGLRRRRQRRKNTTSTATTTTTAITIQSELTPEELGELELEEDTVSDADAFAESLSASVTVTLMEKLPVVVGLQLNEETFSETQPLGRPP